jgi:hypothetical protein
MKRVKTQIVKQRSKEMTALIDTFDPYAGMEGQVQMAWVNTEISPDGRHIVGHTKNYTKILIPRYTAPTDDGGGALTEPLDDQLQGAKVEVKFVSVARWHIVGELLRVLVPPDNSHVRTAVEDEEVQIHTGKKKEGEEACGTCGGDSNKCSSSDGSGSNKATVTTQAAAAVKAPLDTSTSAGGAGNKLGWLWLLLAVLAVIIAVYCSAAQPVQEELAQ